MCVSQTEQSNKNRKENLNCFNMIFFVDFRMDTTRKCRAKLYSDQREGQNST